MRTIAHEGRGEVYTLLIVLPLVLFAISLGFDVVAMLSGAHVWGALAFANLAAGLVSAALACMVFVRVHQAYRPGSRARERSLLFLWLGACAIVPFAVSLVLRAEGRDGSTPPASVFLSIVALGLATLAAFFGDEALRERR
jgi:uncharacterized membrane protein